MEPQYFDEHTSYGLVKELKKRAKIQTVDLVMVHFQSSPRGFNILEP